MYINFITHLNEFSENDNTFFYSEVMVKLYSCSTEILLNHEDLEGLKF